VEKMALAREKAARSNEFTHPVAFFPKVDQKSHRIVCKPSLPLALCLQSIQESLRTNNLGQTWFAQSALVFSHACWLNQSFFEVPFEN
jgi:hypothetical protein